MKRRKRLLVAGAGLVAFVLGLLSSLSSARAGERFDLKVSNHIFAEIAGDREALARGMVRADLDGIEWRLVSNTRGQVASNQDPGELRRALCRLPQR
jgi:hypothetical protein